MLFDSDYNYISEMKTSLKSSNFHYVCVFIIFHKYMQYLKPYLIAKKYYFRLL